MKIIDFTIIIFVLVFSVFNLLINGLFLSVPMNLEILASLIISAFSYTALGFLLCIVSKKDIVESSKPFKLNYSFRIALFFKIIICFILWKDSFSHLQSYQNFSWRLHIISNLPIFIWIGRCYFTRLVRIENNLNNKL